PPSRAVSSCHASLSLSPTRARRRREGRGAVRALAAAVRVELPSVPSPPSSTDDYRCRPRRPSLPLSQIEGRAALAARRHHSHPASAAGGTTTPTPTAHSRAKATARVRAARRRLAPWEALSKAARSRLRQGRDPPANPSLNKRVSSTAGAHGVGRAPCGRRRHGNRSLRRRREAVAPGGMRLFLQADAAAYHPNGRPG
ncbi:unnamed protein product, partial [Urochloa humidicola]